MPEKLESRHHFAAFIAGNPTAYSTIQAAVNAAAPGATINVEAGVYPEWVYVDKKLTLRGAQAGVDARTTTRVNGAAPETIVTGINLGTTQSGAFHILANSVTLDGFTVQGNTDPSVTTGAGIVMAPKISGTHIFNNIVQNNVAGIYLSNYSSSSPAIIQRNLFRYNNNPGVNGGRGIYSDPGISGGNLTNVTIDNNAFIRNYGGTGTTTVEAAIAFESYTANVQSNFRITSNVFDANGKAVLAFNASDFLIENNVASYQKDQWSGVFRFEGNVHDVTMRGNNVYGNPGPAIRIDSKAVPGENYNFFINGNNFYNNDTVYTRNAIETFADQYSGTLDARNNWWGSSGGPGVGGADTYNTGGASIAVSPYATAPVVQRLSPFYGAPNVPGVKIEAEDFDHGGEAVAYHDSDVYNSGGQWRNYEYADVEKTTDTGGGYNISYARAGEWLAYSLNVTDPGTYSLDLRLANAQTGSLLHIEIDGVNVSGSISSPNTGGWQNWTTITIPNISLSSGAHFLKLVFDVNGTSGGGPNVNWLKLNPVSVTPTPVPTAPAAPSNLAAVLATATQASLSWVDNSNNETSFIIERKINSGSWQLLATAGAGITAFSDPNLSAGTIYSYRVRATNAVGDSVNSNEASVTTPAPTPQPVTYLSDLAWISSTNGWGPVERDMSVGGSGSGDGATLTLNGVTYAKGLGVHAPSEIVYNLNGAYIQFVSDIGIDDRQTTNGSVVFQIFADGVKRYDSGVMSPTTATKTITIDMTGVQQLKLVVTDGGDGIDYDHADWAGARLLTSSTTPPPTPPPPPTPAPTIPNAPSNLVATAITFNKITLTWTDNSTDESGFKVYRSTDGITWTLVTTLAANTTTYTNTGLAKGAKYYYKVTAFNTAGESTATNISSATTPKR